MTELDELERDLLQAADTWFNQALPQKLHRVIQLARDGQVSLKAVNARLGILEAYVSRRMVDAGPIKLTDCEAFYRDDDPFGLVPSNFP